MADVPTFPIVPTTQIEVAVAVDGGGYLSVCPHCQYHVQINAKYLAWKEEMKAKGCAISIIRAHVPIPESLLQADSVTEVE